MYKKVQNKSSEKLIQRRKTVYQVQKLVQKNRNFIQNIF